MMQFREKELRYFYNNFLQYSGIDHANADEYDKLCFYFDAFVFCTVAASESADNKTRRLFYKIKPFPYIKALRNISAHYGPPHIIRNSQSSPFFTRLINETFGPLGNKIELRINIESSIKEIEKAHDLFKTKNQGKENDTYKSAISYLESISGQPVLIHNLFKCVVDALSHISEKSQQHP